MWKTNYHVKTNKMTNFKKYQIELEKAKNEMKMYSAGLLVAKAFQSELSRFDLVCGEERFLFRDNKFWFCGDLNVTSKNLTHFQFMTNSQKDSYLNKLKRALKLLESTEGGKYYAYEAYKDITE